MGLLSSLFKSKKNNSVEEQEIKAQKEFDILKYDGIRAYRMRRFDYAQKCFEEAIKLQDDYETYGHLAQLLVEKGDLQGALTPLLHMAKSEPTIVTNYITLANVYFLLEDYFAMADKAQLAIHLEPTNPQAYYLKGKAANALNNDGEAISLFSKAIELQADYAEALLLRGQTYLHKGQLEAALKDAEAVIASENELESGLLLHGAVKEAQQEITEAEVDYLRVLEIDPFCQQAYLNLGKLYIQQQRVEDAIGTMNDAIEMSPVFSEAYALRAEAKKLLGDAEGAAKDATAAANLKAAGEVKTEIVDPAASIKEIDIMHL
ncbi:MAG: tetratricopeptide repeat protein [Bacteroidaceae bacterium]|nr:tetratricopeptide repeat protein [Bacteroidaceae bacterium]